MEGNDSLEIVNIDRGSGIEFIKQAAKDLDGQAVPTSVAIADLLAFTEAWKNGVSPEVLNRRFAFKVVRHAECKRRGILLYEIYICRQKYRAVIAWFSVVGPGYWVAIFKKQGSQSTTDIRTAGDRAIRQWKTVLDPTGDTDD